MTTLEDSFVTAIIMEMSHFVERKDGLYYLSKDFNPKLEARVYIVKTCNIPIDDLIAYINKNKEYIFGHAKWYYGDRNMAISNEELENSYNHAIEEVKAMFSRRNSK